MIRRDEQLGEVLWSEEIGGLVSRILLQGSGGIWPMLVPQIPRTHFTHSVQICSI